MGLELKLTLTCDKCDIRTIEVEAETEESTDEEVAKLMGQAIEGLVWERASGWHLLRSANRPLALCPSCSETAKERDLPAGMLAPYTWTPIEGT